MLLNEATLKALKAGIAVSVAAGSVAVTAGTFQIKPLERRVDHIEMHHVEDDKRLTDALIAAKNAEQFSEYQMRITATLLLAAEAPIPPMPDRIVGMDGGQPVYQEKWRP